MSLDSQKYYSGSHESAGKYGNDKPKRGNTLLIPGWEEHQNVAALEQIRASNRKRQARYREQAKIEAVEQEHHRR
mgnify:CR=1 FL=1